MATETHLATQQIRLQQWAEMVRECKSRPRGMKIADWCREYGITKDAYYYRLNRVRKACLETINLQTGLEQQAVVPVPPGLLSERQHSNPLSSGIDITLNQPVIHVSDQTSPELLAMVVEVLSQELYSAWHPFVTSSSFYIICTFLP